MTLPALEHHVDELVFSNPQFTVISGLYTLIPRYAFSILGRSSRHFTRQASKSPTPETYKQTTISLCSAINGVMQTNTGASTGLFFIWLSDGLLVKAWLTFLAHTGYARYLSGPGVVMSKNLLTAAREDPSRLVYSSRPECTDDSSLAIRQVRLCIWSYVEASRENATGRR